MANQDISALFNANQPNDLLNYAPVPEDTYVFKKIGVSKLTSKERQIVAGEDNPPVGESAYFRVIIKLEKETATILATLMQKEPESDIPVHFIYLKNDNDTVKDLQYLGDENGLKIANISTFSSGKIRIVKYIDSLFTITNDLEIGGNLIKLINGEDGFRPICTSPTPQITTGNTEFMSVCNQRANSYN
ncbi:hypothetical protein GCM10027035_38880 [Emticicia sediminis]